MTQPYQPERELVDVIDDEGRTIGVVTRKEMRERKLPHRCTYVLVFNRAGELFTHLRTSTKDVYPSNWDVTPGGVSAAGESWDEGIRREIAEELGVEGEPEELFPFRYADKNSSIQGMVYRLFHDGPFKLQPEEIVRGEFLPIDEVLRRASREPFCPDGLEVLAEYRRRFPPLPVPANQRVLLGSGGFRTPERVETLRSAMRSFFGSVDRLLFIPYALADYDGYVRKIAEKRLDAGYPLDGIHRHVDPQRAVREAAAIYVGGGNTFRLLDTLYRFGLVEAIRERVRAGVPYLGISAGSNVAGPTIKTTNDMPICQPPCLGALGLVPFQLNPHYFNGKTFVERDGVQHEHFGETRDDRLREFHEMNATPVVGLWEAGILRIENGGTWLDAGQASIFLRGKNPVAVTAGTNLNARLGYG